MFAQIGLGHRRDRMVPHRRVPVEAEDFAVKAGASKQVAENTKSLQRRHTDDERHKLFLKTLWPISIARPMLPISGDESNVEQTL